MQRITNKITGEVYEAEQLFDPMLNNAILKVEFKFKDGSVKRVKARHPANLFLGKVPPGTPIIIMLNNLKCWNGRFGGIENSDEGYEITLLHHENDDAIGFNTRNLIGYFIK